MRLTTAGRLLDALRHTIIALVRRDAPDLAARQLAVFLTCYLSEQKQTVRGLAVELKVSKSAITRVLDRLEHFGLAKREPEPGDRRSIVVARTPKGTAFLRELKTIMAGAVPPGVTLRKTPM